MTRDLYDGGGAQPRAIIEVKDVRGANGPQTEHGFEV